VQPVQLAWAKQWKAQVTAISITMCDIMSNAKDFTDSVHSVAELAFQGATELDLEGTGKPEIGAAIEAWNNRPNQHSSGIELFHMEHCSAFAITHEGMAGDYWPSEKENDIVETLIRDFLYPRGICNVSDFRVRLCHLKYNLMALSGDEYVLVCPYLTEAGNISGLLIVCVTKVMR